jgi:hypothetical protein
VGLCRLVFWGLGILGLTIWEGWALGPHEIVVIENAQSPDSREIAQDYCRTWQVPETNRISIDVPLPARDGVYDLTPEDFTCLIWEPVNRAIQERGLAGHILAWVYSAGFPVRVTTQPAMSLTGLTWVRNRPPPQEKIEKGDWNSPVFVGPARPGATYSGTQSLDVFKDWLGDDMPLPSMMLGYLGVYGNTREEILRTWDSQLSPTRPEGTVYFVTNADIRSQCRDWQFANAARELRALGVSVRMTSEWPSNNISLMGLMTGQVRVSPQTLNLKPGSIGDHLTSFGAVFEETGQTRISEWIRAGACASAGTVTEPMSIAAKFPNGRLFAHLARGVTVLESYALATKCPLQLLLLGDPLAAPWSGPRTTLRLSGMEAGPVLRKPTRIQVAPDLSGRDIYTKYLFLCDGVPLRPRGPESEILLDPGALAPGRHRLRCVAYGAGTIRRQAWGELKFSCEPLRN